MRNQHKMLLVMSGIFILCYHESQSGYEIYQIRITGMTWIE